MVAKQFIMTSNLHRFYNSCLKHERHRKRMLLLLFNSSQSEFGKQPLSLIFFYVSRVPCLVVDEKWRLVGL
jgi:hypothetical protein